MFFFHTAAYQNAIVFLQGARGSKGLELGKGAHPNADRTRQAPRCGRCEQETPQGVEVGDCALHTVIGRNSRCRNGLEPSRRLSETNRRQPSGAFHTVCPAAEVKTGCPVQEGVGILHTSRTGNGGDGLTRSQLLPPHTGKSCTSYRTTATRCARPRAPPLQGEFHSLLLVPPNTPQGPARHSGESSRAGAKQRDAAKGVAPDDKERVEFGVVGEFDRN